MKHVEYLVCLWAGMILLFSCRDAQPYPEAMRQAERCISQYPDSALAYLSSLESRISSEPEETRMYYQLLTVKANDKLYVPHTTDSVMKAVVRFYESYGDADKLMEAYYYLGSVYRDMKDAPRALTTFQQAADAGRNSRRYDMLGQLYEQTGTLLAYQSLYEDAMEDYKEAYRYYQREKEEAGMVYALRNMGRMHEFLGGPDSMEHYYRAAYTKAFETQDQRIINSLAKELGNVYLDLGKPDSAEKVFTRIPLQKDNPLYLYGIGSIYLAKGQLDSTRLYYHEALQAKNPNIYLRNSLHKALAQIEARKGNYRTAFEYAQKSLALTDSIEEITRTEAIGKIHAFYNYRYTEKENQRLLLDNEKKRNQNYLLIIGLLLLAGVIVFFIYYVKKQKRMASAQSERLSQLKDEQYRNSQAYLRANETRITQLELSLQRSEGQKDILQKQLILAEKELLELSNRKIQLVQNEKDLLVLALRKSDIYRFFHQAAKQDRAMISEENWKTLQQALEATYANFINKLFTLYPHISEQELRMCCLIKIQIPVKSIGELLNRTTSAITNSRIRLYKKIHGTEGKAEALDKFILDL